MMKKIRLAKIYGKKIAIRQSIQLLKKEITASKSEQIILDFDKIEFISRSFADELYKYLQENKEKQWQLINIASEVQQMLQLVEESRKTKRKLIHLENIKILDLSSAESF